MGCEVVQTAWGPTFFCGEGIGPQPPIQCHFCGDTGLYLCDWKVERFEDAEAHLIHVGDLLRPIGKDKRQVVYRDIDDRLVYLGIEVRGTVLQTAVPRHGKFSVLKSATCDQACCQNCARAVDDDRHYCCDHWNAWKDVS